MSGEILGLYIYLTVMLVGIAFACGKVWQRLSNLEKSYYTYRKEVVKRDLEEDLDGRVSELEGRFKERNSHVAST